MKQSVDFTKEYKDYIKVLNDIHSIETEKAYKAGIEAGMKLVTTSNNKIMYEKKQELNSYEEKREGGLIINRRVLITSKDDMNQLSKKIDLNLNGKFKILIDLMNENNIICEVDSSRVASIEYLANYFEVSEKSFRYKILAELKKYDCLKIVKTKRREFVVISPRFATRTKYISDKLFFIYPEECSKIMYEVGIEKFEKDMLKAYEKHLDMDDIIEIKKNKLKKIINDGNEWRDN